jgi:hypothetical protein
VDHRPGENELIEFDKKQKPDHKHQIPRDSKPGIVMAAIALCFRLGDRRAAELATTTMSKSMHRATGTWSTRSPSSWSSCPLPVSSCIPKSTSSPSVFLLEPLPVRKTGEQLVQSNDGVQKGSRV